MIFDLDLRLTPPKGDKNPFLYYPEYFEQDSSQSIIDGSGKYDLTRFSMHESEIVRQVLFTAKNKYPKELRALGLVNESYPIKYKPRYVLFEIAVVSYCKSSRPEDHIAVGFAYLQKGAQFREKAISHYERSIDFVSFQTLDMFASLSALGTYLNLSGLYEKEKRYIDAGKWIKKAIARGGGNTEYFVQKLETIKAKENTPQKKRRKAKVSEDSMDFERKTYSAAIYFMKKFGWE